MPKEQFEKLQRHVGGLISFNSFLSTSTDEHRSLLFARSSLDDPDSKVALFVIHVDLSLSASLVGFLDDRLTYFPGENAYLWDMNSIFRIDDIQEKENGVWQVNLIHVASDDSQLKQLTDYMRKDVGVSSGLRRLGNLMIDMGEWSKARDIYETLLREQADPFAIQQLGLIAHRMNDLDTALGHYRHALSVSTAPNDSEQATIHSNMGCVLNDKECHGEALEQFKHTLHLQRNMQTPNSLHIVGILSR